MSTSSTAQPSILAYLNRKRRSDTDQNDASRKSLMTGVGKADVDKNVSERNKVEVDQKCYTNLLICGYTVKLPHDIQPYTMQRTMISKILTSLKNRLNALIESPTGSGKTLGLLSASCAWLERYKAERMQSRDECRACNGGRLVSSMTDRDGESKSSGLNVSGPLVNTSTLGFTDAESVATLEDEYESDFYVVTNTSFRSHKSEGILLLDDIKNAKKEGEDEGHTCMPRVTIYYGTRTHKQISQVVKEFSRLPYSRKGLIKHTILASREHMCINPITRADSDINGKCKDLIAPDGIGCSFKNSMRLKYERPGAIRRLIAQTTGEVHRIWDVEDLVETLKCSTPPLCPYFSSARVLIDDADIVFCPFSYLIDPIIRANSGLSLKNMVVILDEAHNVEDVCREAVSFSFTERELVGAIGDFCQKASELDKELAKVDAKVFAEQGQSRTEECTRSRRFQEYLGILRSHLETVISFLNKALNWFVSVAVDATQVAPMKNDRLGYAYSWEKLFTTFANHDLNKFDKVGKGTPYTSLLEAFSIISGAGNDNDEFQQYFRDYKPGGAAIVCVEKFLYFFKSYFRSDNRTAYKLFVCIDKPFVPYSNVFERTENPLTHIDILDTNFNDKEKPWLDSKMQLEGYRAIKYGYRVTLSFWCMRPSLAYIDAFKECRSVILASGTLSPRDTFRTELGTTFKQEMEGSQIIPAEQIFAAVIPTGPSGGRLCGTYRIINQNNRFIREISLILRHVSEIIPKGVLCFFSSYRVLEQIYEYMETSGILRQIQNMKVVLKEPRRSSQMNTIMTKYENAVANPVEFGTQCTGALMMAVFRGKVSEGIDFADDRARCVVAVGIPFPNAMDEQVTEKKKYNDEYCKKLQILSGDEWYTMQAYRALNQALGRCLRHRLDWGSILMLDERLLQTRANPNAKKVSRWIREQLRPLTSYKHFLSELKKFVCKMEEKDRETVRRSRGMNDGDQQLNN